VAHHGARAVALQVGREQQVTPARAIRSVVRIELERETVMLKLVITAACLWVVAMPLSAMAQNACQQRCLQNTSGKGPTALTQCQQRCAVHGTARR
jgi:hypothetical protein